jgi:hypothetical protein
MKTSKRTPSNEELAAEIQADADALSAICRKYAIRKGVYLQLRSGVHPLAKKERSNGLIQITDLIDALWDKGLPGQTVMKHHV